MTSFPSAAVVSMSSFCNIAVANRNLKKKKTRAKINVLGKRGPTGPEGPMGLIGDVGREGPPGRDGIFYKRSY